MQRTNLLMRVFGLSAAVLALATAPVTARAVDDEDPSTGEGCGENNGKVCEVREVCTMVAPNGTCQTKTTYTHYYPA